MPKKKENELKVVNIRLVKEPSLYSEEPIRSSEDVMKVIAKELKIPVTINEKSESTQLDAKNNMEFDKQSHLYLAFAVRHRRDLWSLRPVLCHEAVAPRHLGRPRRPHRQKAGGIELRRLGELFSEGCGRSVRTLQHNGRTLY